jgi:hypothetical protein
MYIMSIDVKFWMLGLANNLIFKAPPNYVKK